MKCTHYFISNTDDRNAQSKQNIKKNFVFSFSTNIYISNQTDQGIYDEDLNNSQNPSLSEAFYLCNLVWSNQL